MKSTRSFASRWVALGAAVSVLAPMSALAQDAKPLLFVSNRGENKMKFNIYSMKPDGSDQKNLTKSESMELDPALSPDGKMIAFVVMKPPAKPGEKPEFSLMAMKADGTERKQIADIKSMITTPVWSPDSKRIAFSSVPLDMIGSNAPKFTMQVMDADGKNQKEIGEGMVSAWSPDGKTILCSRFMGGGGDFAPYIYTMNADGTNAKKLTDTKSMMGVFSPDGKRIAYIAESEGMQPDLYVMNADGTDKSQLTKTAEMEMAAQWSADGKQLYFLRFPMGNPGNPLEGKIEIFRMDADGKNEKTLTKDSGLNLLPGGALVLVFAASRQAGAGEEATAKPEEVKKP